jgi:hypothetical protein
LAVPVFGDRGIEVIAIKDDAFHRAGGIHGFFFGVVAITGEESTAYIAVGGTELADHIFPGQQNRDSDALTGGIVSVPAIDGYRVAGLFVVVGQDWRELF